MPLDGQSRGSTNGLICRSLGEFLQHEYPPVEHIIQPWLPRRGLAMMAGYRGIGKTYVGLSVAYAIATGGTLLGFSVPEPRAVLYVDGEMDPADLQQRLREIDNAARRDGNGEPELAAANLRILTHADQRMGIPDLADPQDDRGRRLVTSALGGAEVLILDNLSSLCRTGIENDAESWVVMQDWLLSLRRDLKTVLLIHHTGKPDEKGKVRQRGTSKREDVLNTSILLRDGKPGGRFTWEFTKARGFQAPDPIAVRLEIEDGCCTLNRHYLDLTEEIGKLLDEGLTQKEIAPKLGVSESTVSRHKPKDRVSAKAAVQEPEKSAA